MNDSFIALQKRADEEALVLTRDGYREQAEVIRDLRRFAYAQWDANHVAMGALSRAPSMEPKP